MPILIFTPTTAVSPPAPPAGAQTATGFFTGDNTDGRLISTGFTVPPKFVRILGTDGNEWTIIDKITTATAGVRTDLKRATAGAAATATNSALSGNDFVVDNDGGVGPNRNPNVYIWFAST